MPMHVWLYIECCYSNIEMCLEEANSWDSFAFLLVIFSTVLYGLPLLSLSCFMHPGEGLASTRRSLLVRK
jgi:hypothetical protein